MPHIAIDYTPNIAREVIRLKLVEVVHQAALDTQVFPVWGIRTLGRPAEIFKVARGDTDMGFVQIMVRIAPGRDLKTRQQIARSLFNAAEEALEPLFSGSHIGLQLELQEFDLALTLNRTTLKTP